MARKPRVHYAGGVYHVMLRGNGGKKIFFDDEDREHFYWLIHEGIKRYDHQIHGFCLMDNHLHMAIQVGETPLSKIMQNLSFRYTRWINKKKKRIGHLFQGRYKALLVEQDSYLLELVRYIHLNPVRAKLVKSPGRYRWSGHNAYLGLETFPWLTTEWVLQQFGKRVDVCRRHYETFVAEGMNEGYREEFHQGGEDARILGDEGYTGQVIGKQYALSKKPDLTKIVQLVCESYEIELQTLQSPSRQRDISLVRQIITWLVYKTEAVTLKDLGEYFGREASVLSKHVRRIELALQADKKFKREIEKLYNAIVQA